MRAAAEGVVRHAAVLLEERPALSDWLLGRSSQGVSALRGLLLHHRTVSVLVFVVFCSKKT